MQIIIVQCRTDNDGVDLCKVCFALCQIITGRQADLQSGLTDTNLVNFVHHVNSDYLGPLLGPS